MNVTNVTSESTKRRKSMTLSNGKSHYLRYLAFTLAGWVALSVLTVPRFYLASALTGSEQHVGSALGGAFLASAGWAVIALLLMVFSAGLRQRQLGRITSVGCHLLFGVVLVLVLLLLMRWWQWPVLGLADTLRAPDLITALWAGWPLGLVIFAGLWGLCHVGWLWRNNAQLKAQLVTAELRRLRTQLNPHFLFNSLNAISELGYTDPEAADRTITQLSGLLRKSLDEGHQQEIALRNELDFLKRYLDIQQTLLRGRLQVEFDIADRVLNARVPGMILQPLVENAITHGIHGGGYLGVRARRELDALVIEVEDNGWGLRASNAHKNGHGGIGIDNTRARLGYLYGELASLELFSRAGEGVTVRLGIPFHEAFAFDENPYLDRR